MSALLPLAFPLGELYHEFEMQESLLSCIEFMNDKIIKHEVRQACNAWILELLHNNNIKSQKSKPLQFIGFAPERILFF